MLDPDAAARIDAIIRARGPDYETFIDAQRERRNKQKRDARKRQTPEQRAGTRARDRTRKVVAREQRTPEQQEHDQARDRARSRTKVRPFMAIDGEGGGTDPLGRQHYLLMVASGTTPGDERIRHNDGKPLSVKDCLEFILSLPASHILVGFGFGYDVTQILRGITKVPALRRILNPVQGKNGPLSTYWGDYAITYQQGQYFRVVRLDPVTRKPNKPTSRTVYETLGFFQCAFIKAIEHWKIGSEAERKIIARNKAQRDEFSKLTKGIIQYCKLECRSLASLMTEFREVCTAVGIKPPRWSGAGSLAAALLDKHDLPKRPLTRREIAAQSEQKPAKNPKPKKPRRPQYNRDFEAAANNAYYGGRFEVSRIGSIAGPVYEYDLKSAYPAAMLDLPCPLHTRWEHKRRAKGLPTDGLYLAKISFSHADTTWCGLPFRQNGGLFWPLQGTGWYWSPEIEAARRRLAPKLVVRDLWIARRGCDCRPFDWVCDLYDERRRLGSDTRGYPIKLALNSLYGKMAQRCGRGPYHDCVAAGLITAITRAQLIEAIGLDPEAVVMLATDAVFSTRPLALDLGNGLGQWEQKIWPDLFIVKPGVYWSPSDLLNSVKSRGAPRSIIGGAVHRFHQVFAEWFDLLHQPDAREVLLCERQIPSAQVKVRIFIGCRLALSRGKSWQAGKWEDVPRHESFDWKTKRDAKRIAVGDGYVATYPIALPSPLTESQGYKPADFDRLIEISGENGAVEEIDENTWWEAMSDHLQFLPHDE
jgi:hypothetical protein